MEVGLFVAALAVFLIGGFAARRSTVATCVAIGWALMAVAFGLLLIG